MDPETPETLGDDVEGPGEAHFEDLLRSYVDRLIAGERVDPAEIRRLHPEGAEELIAELEILRELGAAKRSGEAQPGLGVVGGYRLLRQIGRGGMGVVYEAWDEAMERRVAVKILPGGLLGDLRATVRFHREAKAAGRLRHPNILSVHAMGIHENTPYYVMDLVEGETLAQLLARLRGKDRAKAPDGGRPGGPAAVSSTPGPLDTPAVTPAYCYKIADAFAGVAEGLQHAHENGVIHRDIKPSNILIDRDGTLRILDFGLARLEGHESLTRTGDFVGTPLYVSPEQTTAGRTALDCRTDIYSLGATLYEILTWRPPLEGKDPHDTLSQIARRDPPEPRSVNPRIPRDLETIVLKCLRKPPAERYGTAEALAQDLRRFVRGDPIEARPLSAWEKLAQRAWRHRVRLAVAAVLAISLAAVGVMALRRAGDARRLRLTEYGPRVLRAVQRLRFGRHSTRVGIERVLRFDPGEYFVADAEQPWARLSTDESTGDPAGALQEAGALDPVRDAVSALGSLAEEVREKPDALYHRARGLLLLADVDGALREIERTLARDPDFAPALILKAAILENQGDALGARSAIAEAEQSSRSAWARALVSAHRAVDGARWREAVEAYDEAIRIEGADGEPYIGASVEMRLARGGALLRLGEIEAAERDFAVALDLWPDALDAVLLLGEAYCLAGKRAEANSCFLRFHGRTEYKEQAALAMAARCFYFNEFELGLRWADRLENGRARERIRPFLLTCLDRSAEALQEAEKALDRHTRDPAFLFTLGSALSQQEDISGLKDLLHRIQDPRLPHPMLDCGIGQTILAAGDIPGAIERFEQGLRIREMIGLRWSLAAARIHGGDLENAYGDYRRGVDVFTRWGIKGSAGDVSFASALGPLLDRIGKPREALEAYARALEVLPEHEPTHRRLSDLLRRARPDALGDSLDRLIGVLEGWKATGVPHPGARAALALARARHPLSKGFAGALEEARLAVEEAGGLDPYVLPALAEIQALSGDRAAAAATLEAALRFHDADPSLDVALAEHRQAILPRIPSFESADSLLGERMNAVLVRADATWRFLRGTRPPSAGLEWTAAEFDSSGWEEGPGPFAAGMGLRAGTWLDNMPGSHTTVYIRHLFRVEDPRAVEDLLLVVWADDGFVAYLNGTEVGRARAGRPGEVIPFEGSATEAAGGRSAPLVGTRRPYGVRIGGSAHLRAGANCLAIQALNHRDSQAAFYVEAMLLARVRPSAERARDPIERSRSTAGAADGHLRYLEGRLLAREGKTEEAADAFRKLCDADPGAPEPRLRRAELLRSSGRSAEALAALAPALLLHPDRRDLWDLGHEIAAVDLGLPASKILEALGPEAARILRAGYGCDVVHLLERLAGGEPVRIDCGGEGFKGPAGEVWAGDTFYTGGESRCDRYEASGEEKDDIHRTVRMFPDLGCLTGGYRVPLPRGEYRITLHFAERSLVRPGKRVFGIRIEGKDVVERYEPLAAGWAVPSARSFPARVEDGFLDIEFPARAGAPAVCGIEIQAEPPPR